LLYGVPVERVQRVVASVLLHGVPGASPHLLLGRIGGEALPVVALTRSDGALVGGYAETVVVVRTGQPDDPEIVGLAVDRVVDVDVAEETAEPRQGATRITLVDPDDLSMWIPDESTTNGDG